MFAERVQIDPGHTGTDFNNHRGPIKVEVVRVLLVFSRSFSPSHVWVLQSGAHVAKYATEFGDGNAIAGSFYGHEGWLPW